MKKFPTILSILLCMLVMSCTTSGDGLSTSLTSSKDGQSSSSNPYVGTWKVSLMTGHRSLDQISSIKISDTSVTMTFVDGDFDLYKVYGKSRTVNYTYKADDVNCDDEKMPSLTFDEPLYFVDYASGRSYVSKVFLKKSSGNIYWSDEYLSHGLVLKK